MKKTLSIVLSLLLVFGAFPTAIFALPLGIEIDSTGADPFSNLPNSLGNGEIWTDKSVTDHENGEFTITLRASGQDYQIQNPLPPDQLDVVLVLDVSGSMSSNSRLPNMKAAAKNAVETLLEVSGNRIAIVKYSGMAEVVENFTNNENTLNGSIDALTAGGGTNIQNAYYVAQNLILNRSDDTRKPIIIMMSDGRPTFYHADLSGHTSSNRLGDGTENNTTGTFVWQTILQAMEAKNNIPNLKIYTIGFAVGSDSFAIATLMPTDSNTASYRPTFYSGEKRSLEESGEYMYTRFRTRNNQNVNWGSWSSWTLFTNPITSRNIDIQAGAWEPFTGYPAAPSDYWTALTPSGSPMDSDVVTSGGNRRQDEYAYFATQRMGEAFRNIISGPIPFDHKYWEDESSISSDNAQAIFDAFVAIVNELINQKPQKKHEVNGYTDIVIEDILGSAFEVIGPLPSGVSENAGVITWTISGNNFNTMPANSVSLDPNIVHEVTFTVGIKNTTGVGYYETNQSAKAMFSVSDDNPFDYAHMNDDDGNITMPLTNKGWLTLIAPDVEGKITITKQITGPVSATDRTFTFSIYDQAVGGTAILSGIEITVNGNGPQSLDVDIDIPYDHFSNLGNVTYYVQEDNQSPVYWEYDNASRKAVNLSLSNPTGSVLFNNVYDPKGTLTVLKSWLNTSPQETITFELQKEISEGIWETVSAGHTIAAGNTSSNPIGNLLLNQKYRVIETPILDYNTSYSPNFVIFTPEILMQTITIINDYQTPIGEITVNKTWDHGDNPDQYRPNSIQFRIQGPNQIDEILTLMPDDFDVWTNTFQTPVFGPYTVTEMVPLDYSVNVNPPSQSIELESLPVENRKGTLDFHNTYVAPKGSITIEKDWLNDEGMPGFRPDAVTFTLYKVGTDEPVDSITMPIPESPNPWIHTFNNLDWGQYYVTESAVPDYTVTYNPQNITLARLDDAGGTTKRTATIYISNSFSDPRGYIDFEKEWVESEVDPNEVRPSAITITLYKNGVYHDSALLSGPNSVWTHRFDNLPLDGSTYTVQESAFGLDWDMLQNYDADYYYNGGNGNGIVLNANQRSGIARIVNSYAKGTIVIFKDWIHGENPESERPTTAQLYLYANVTTSAAIYVNAMDSEDPMISNYETTSEVILISSFSLTYPTVSKTIYNLELGDHIYYYVTEDPIPFYDQHILPSMLVLNEESPNGRIDVQNRYTNPKGSLTVYKEWEHGNNPTPENTVTVSLYGNGTFIESQTFIGSYTFTGLDLGVTYTLVESPIANYELLENNFEGYTPTKGNNSVPSGSVTLVNRYIPERGNLIVNKSWVGPVGQPILITLSRYIGETTDPDFIRTVTLNTDNNWQHTFTDLLVYGPGGLPYTYMASESGSDLVLYTESNTQTPSLTPNGTSTITITNTYAPEKGTLIITKEWLGLEGESIEPPVSSIEVVLIVNGVPEESTMVLNNENSWTVTRSNLNIENTYAVSETSEIEEYNVSYSSTNIQFDVENLNREVIITNRLSENQPEIDITKLISNPSINLVGGTATFNYTLEIVNTGNRTLNSITVTDSMSGPGGASYNYSPVPSSTLPNGSVIYELADTLAPGESTFFNYSVTVNLAGTYQNIATASGLYGEQEVADTDDAQGVVTQPTVDDPDPEDPPPTPGPQGNVIVNYVDTEGTPLSPPFQFFGEVGTNYGTSARTFLGYTLTEIPSNASGTFIEGTITVTYIYTDGSEPIELEEEETPLGPAEPIFEEEDEEELFLIEEDIPLGDGLPETGQLPSAIFYGLGSLISAVGIYLKRRP